MTTTFSRRRLLAAGLALAVIPALLPATAKASTAVPPQDIAALGAPDRTLEARLVALARGLEGTKVGIAVVDIDAGRTALVNGDEMFAMQGINTLPVAIALLHMAEQGAISLERVLTLSSRDIAPGRSPLAARLKARPVKFTARQLIEHMLLNGDTTATDALMRLAGGPAGIRKALSRLDAAEGLRIDRYEHELQPAVFGLKPDQALADQARFKAAIASLDQDTRRRAQLRYLQDPRDTASPRAIASLYARLEQGRLLQRRNAAFVLDLLRRSRTGLDRLSAGMTKGWTLAHRSGQTPSTDGFTAVFNDSGVATARSGSRIAIAVFVEGTTQPVEKLEAFHQALARSVLEAWEPPSRA
jgi:beta-lactamase class A